jgi:hypothetical protein
MNKFAVIFGTHIPSEDKLWIGEDILIKIKKYLPHADIFVGVNPSICMDKWIDVIKKYTKYYEITPHNLTINSDASSYQSALRIYKNHIKDYDLIWFLHTQATKSGRHNVRESHLKCLLYESEDVIKIFQTENYVGAYGTTLSPQPYCWDDDPSEFYLQRFGIKFKNRPIRASFIGTFFVVRGFLVNYFLNNCNESFFNEILWNQPDTKVGDPYFFERDFIHIVDAYHDYVLKAKYYIDNGWAGIPLNGLSDLEHYNRFLDFWKKRNNISF